LAKDALHCQAGAKVIKSAEGTNCHFARQFYLAAVKSRGDSAFWSSHEMSSLLVVSPSAVARTKVNFTRIVITSKQEKVKAF
jgi:hypothetical protein